MNTCIIFGRETNSPLNCKHGRRTSACQQAPGRKLNHIYDSVLPLIILITEANLTCHTGMREKHWYIVRGPGFIQSTRYFLIRGSSHGHRNRVVLMLTSF